MLLLYYKFSHLYLICGGKPEQQEASLSDRKPSSLYSNIHVIKDTTINKTDWSKVAMMSVDMFPCNMMENRSEETKEEQEYLSDPN